MTWDIEDHGHRGENYPYLEETRDHVLRPSAVVSIFIAGFAVGALIVFVLVPAVASWGVG